MSSRHVSIRVPTDLYRRMILIADQRNQQYGKEFGVLNVSEVICLAIEHLIDNWEQNCDYQDQ